MCTSLALIAQVVSFRAWTQSYKATDHAIRAPASDDDKIDLYSASS